MAYDLRYTRDAERSLAALPKSDARRILQKLEDVAHDPRKAQASRSWWSEKAIGSALASGVHLFTLDHGQLIVTVIKIDHRRDAYRR